jgi:hypothetical protein
MDTKQLQLVTFEQAKRLIVLGFDWYANVVYAINPNTNTPGLCDRGIAISHRNDIICSAPTIALALEWVRGNWLLADWLDFSGEYDEDGEPLFYSNYLFGKELRKTSKKAMPRKYIESALLDELLNVLEKEKKI